MRSIGIFTILSGIIIFIIMMVIGYYIHPSNIQHNLYLSWTMALCQILVFAGIGFILYDIAREGDDKLVHLQKKLENLKSVKIEQIPTECLQCGFRFKVGEDMIDSVVICPNCDKETELRPINNSGADEEDSQSSNDS